MTQENTAISYNAGLAIKGIAVLLMVFHHCFYFPCFYVSPPESLSFPYIVMSAGYAKICVPIFAFLTAWTYALHQDKSLAYSAKKIVSFLLHYWLIVLPATLFAFTFCGYHYSLKTLWEFLPITNNLIMIHAWYVWFYILLMAVFPLCGLIEKHPRSKSSLTIFVLSLSSILFCSHFFKHLHMGGLWYWFPVITAGYLIAKFRIFEKALSLVKTNYAALICSLLFLAASYIVWTYDCMILIQISVTVATIAFIFAILLLRAPIHSNKISAVLQVFGKHSMNIWFIHCIFHSRITRNIVQDTFFCCNNLIWIYGCVVLTALILSILITPVQHRIVALLMKPFFSK